MGRGKSGSEAEVKYNCTQQYMMWLRCQITKPQITQKLNAPDVGGFIGVNCECS